MQAALDSAAEEMFEVLRKTAMSPIIYEVLDVGTGVTSADGALVSSGAGIPSFVGVLDNIGHKFGRWTGTAVLLLDLQSD